MPLAVVCVCSPTLTPTLTGSAAHQRCPVHMACCGSTSREEGSMFETRPALAACVGSHVRSNVQLAWPVSPLQIALTGLLLAQVCGHKDHKGVGGYCCAAKRPRMTATQTAYLKSPRAAEPVPCSSSHRAVPRGMTWAPCRHAADFALGKALACLAKAAYAVCTRRFASRRAPF